MARQGLGLREMRLAATGILIALVLIYLATFTATDPGWPTKLLRAAAGAGIVGALADWFAVVALFRHPLGVPIPHTALLLRNQQRVAVNVGRFIEDNFLQSDLIVSKLRNSEISKKIAIWFLEGDRADYLVRRLISGLNQALRADLNDDVQAVLSKMIRRLIHEASADPKMASEISKLLQYGLTGPTLTSVVFFLRETVEENHSAVRRLVRDNSRWWIASRLDRNASELIVNGLISVLDELAKPESELRLDFEQAASDILRNVSKTDQLQTIIDSVVQDYTQNDAFEGKLRDLICNLKNKFADYLDSQEAMDAIQASLRKTAQDLTQNPVLQAKADDTIARFADSLLPEVRPLVGSFVTQTISEWDPDLLVERFETETGKDLQFIRINGSLLGSAIGGVLFSVEHLFS